MIRRAVLICLLVITVVSSGCFKRPPEGFPKVYKTLVKVVKDGTPMQNIRVILLPEDRPLNFIVGAKTDSEGFATIETIRGTYKKPGAPEGAYRVMLMEFIKVDMPELSIEEEDRLTERQRRQRQLEFDRKLDALRTVPAVFCEVDKTPLKLSVGGSLTTMEIDVAKR